jgi:hypothetical protein
MGFDVFISYPNQEKATADAVCAALEATKVRCWIAPRDVTPSMDWATAIVEAIDNCRLMVLIFSSRTNESRQVHREVQRAFDQEKPVVPFRIENTAPQKALAYYMTSVHWLDAITPPLEQHLDTLAETVSGLLRHADSAGAELQSASAQRSRIEEREVADAIDRRTRASSRGLSRSALVLALVAGTAAISAASWFAASRLKALVSPPPIAAATPANVVATAPLSPPAAATIPAPAAPSPAIAAPTPATGADHPVVTKSVKREVSLGYLNLRAGPGQDQKIIARIPAGSTNVVMVGTCIVPKDNASAFPFCEIDWNGLRGWVSSSGLE